MADGNENNAIPADPAPIAPAAPTAASRCKGLCWQILQFLFGLLLTVVWRVYKEYPSDDEWELINRIQMIRANDFPPPPHCNLRCISQDLDAQEQLRCHIDEASSRYLQWKDDMESTPRNTEKYENLVLPDGSAFAWHVYSGTELLQDRDMMLAMSHKLQFNFSTWASRLRIEFHPTSDQLTAWAPLFTSFIEKPDTFLPHVQRIMDAKKSTELYDDLPVTSEEVSIAIRHYMNLAAALCEPDVFNATSKDVLSGHGRILESFVDQSATNLGLLLPWGQTHDNTISLIYRAALSNWLRAELLRLGAPYEQAMTLTFRRFKLGSATVSKRTLAKELTEHNTRIPSCLFRQALFENGGIEDSVGDLLLGPHVEILPGELDNHQIETLARFDWSNKFEDTPGPKPLRATDLVPNEIGTLKFVHPTTEDRSTDRVRISGPHDRTVEWKLPSEVTWMGAQTDLQLHSGSFRLNFAVDSLQEQLLTIGFLLAWTPTWPDREFCGLGSGTSAWAYEPFLGGIIFDNEKIASDVISLTIPNSGIVSLQLDLPRDTYGRAQFIVEGLPIGSFLLPRAAVIVPVVCLVQQHQKVRLLSLGRHTVSNETVAAIEAQAKRLKAIWNAQEDQNNRLPSHIHAPTNRSTL